MAATSEGENLLGLSKKDLSLIRHSLEAGGKLIHQVINGLKHGTSEVQQLILQQSDVILECRVCRNLFRSLPNYLDHKRIYCCELFPNASVSLLASPFADEVPIIYPEPPDDAKEFVEMSDLMSQINEDTPLESVLQPTLPKIRESIGSALEQSCRRKKPQPLYLKPMKETKVAMQLVPLPTENTDRKQNQVVFASHEKSGHSESQKKPYASEARNVGHSLIKLANFRKLLCLKCNQKYSSKKRLIHHIKKFHIKKYHNFIENKTNNNKNDDKYEDSSSKERKQKKLKNTKTDLDVFSTKSGQPSLKKFSYLAKKSTLMKYSDIKNGWCHICNHSYSGKRGLVFHMFRMHSGCRKIYPCLFCNVKFPSFASALRHTKSLHHCSKKEMKHVVKRLKASGKIENQQLKNMLEPEVKVEKCDSQINRLFTLSSINPSGTHSSPATEEEDDEDNNNLMDPKSSLQISKFKCQKCYQVFSGIRGLRLHMTRKHPVAKKTDHCYTCHICFLAFFTNFSLKKHYRLKHNIQDDVLEKEVNKERQSKPGFIPVKTEDVICEGTSKYLVDKNIILHNNKKYRIPTKYYKTVSKLAHFPSLCLDCKQRFTKARELIWHIIKVHCTYKNAFPCPFCHLHFISSVSILRHTKVQHSCSEEEIAELTRKLQVWEQQKKRNVRKAAANNLPSESTNDEGDDNKKNDEGDDNRKNDEGDGNRKNEHALKKLLTINDVIDFETLRCLVCKQNLSGFQGLATHITKVHTVLSNQKHQCLKCKESFDTVFTIIKHMENVHNLVYKTKRLNQPKIDILKVQESAGPSLSYSHVVDEKPFQKKFYPSRFDKTYGEDASNSQLVMQCADFFKSRCLRCKEIFAGNRGLIAHIYKAHAHHSQTYSCYICLKSFKSYALASQHTRNSHIYKGSAMMHVRVDNINAGENNNG